MRPYYLILLFLFSNFTLSYGQFEPTAEECSIVVRDIANEHTGQNRFVSKNEIRLNDMNTGDLYQISILRTKEDFSFIIKGLQRGCFKRKTSVKFLFRSGASFSFPSINKENCESLLLASMGGIYGNDDSLGDFLNEYLIGIEFTNAGSKKVRLKIGTPQNEMIQEVFECLTVGYEHK